MNESWKPRDWRSLLNHSWRLGRPFGVEVRLHWMVVLMPLLMWVYTDNLLYGFIFSVMLYVVVYTHEMGHIAAGWRYRIRTSLITLSPMGGVAHMQASAPHRLGDIFISLAGPATHLPWLLLAWIGTLTLDPTSYGAWIARGFFGMNLGLLIFNLLPIYPLDGGRVFMALLSYRLPDYRAKLIGIRVGQVGGALMVLSGFFPVPIFGYARGGPILMAIGISVLLACHQALQMLRYGAMTYERRQPWEMDSDAWKHGENAFGKEPSDKGPGFLEKRREKKSREEHNRRIQEAEDLEKELDRILEKVHHEGMPSLTDAERSTLKKASEKRRGG